MSSLDSRFLRLGDCFAQKFSRPGTYKYIVTTGAGACLPASEGEYEIVVAALGAGKTHAAEQKGPGSEQHNVAVREHEGKLTAQPARLEIKQGDTVLWYTPDASAPGFAVVGIGEEGSFSSGALTAEAVYSHAFGLPGTYKWIDANGGTPRGEVVVEQMEMRHGDDCRKWLESLSKGTLIKVAGGKAELASVRILAGQTVFWAVEKADGISITDAGTLEGRKRQ